MRAQYVIVGNGVAGVNAAKTIADAKPGASIVVLAAEKYHYYNRWQLPAFLAGELAQDEILFYPPRWYEDHGIAVHLNCAVTQLDPAGHQVSLCDGRQVSYERLLLAAGGAAIVPPAIAGTAKRGVLVLRTLDDALAIKAYAADVKEAVVIGGGLLGLEAAHALHALGLTATVIEFFPRLLPRQLDGAGAEVFRTMVETSGVKVITGAVCREILGDGRATGVGLQGGEIVQGELVLISAGIRSRSQLAQAAGLEVKRGVVVNERLQTSAPDIYAAGDVAEFNGQVYGIIPAAFEQARVAALSMLGIAAAPYAGTVPLTTLKVAGIDLTSIGDVNPEGGGVQEYRVTGREKGLYRKIVLREGHIVGAILIGDKANVSPVTRLIKAGADLSAQADRLSEENLDFRRLPSAGAPKLARYQCAICGYVYDPAKGDPDGSVPSGTPFDKLADDWTCPDCGASKALFVSMEG